MSRRSANHYGNRADWTLPLPDVTFDYVDSKYLAHAPSTCPRCGGIWRGVDEGYVCTACGRRWRAGDCLLKMVSRALAHTDREMGVRMNNPAPPRGRAS